MDDREIDRAIAVGRVREVRVSLTATATMIIASNQDVPELDPSEVLACMDSYEIEEV